MSFLARPFSIAAMRPSALASLSSFASLEVDENVSTKVVKIIQSYTGVVDKMVWRKQG